jgi:hypothetical protein
MQTHMDTLAHLQTPPQHAAHSETSYLTPYRIRDAKNISLSAHAPDQPDPNRS